MPKKKTKQSKKNNDQKQFLSRLLILLGVLFFVITIPYFMYMTSRPTQISRPKAVTCNDSNCENVYLKNYNMYQITNCNASGDPDGDQQLCNTKGRIGTCRDKQYCCPGTGMKWTTSMTACPSATNTPAPTTKPTDTPAPTNKPTNTPTTKPTVAPTVIKSGCNGACSSNATCQSGLVCALFTDGSKKCRNMQCLTASTCTCPIITPTLAVSVTPIPSPTPTLDLSLLSLSPLPTVSPEPPVLSVNTFTNNKNETTPQFTLSGKATPYSEISIQIPESSVLGTTLTDGNGNWRYILTKQLNTGKNTLILRAKTSEGLSSDLKQEFTVVAKGTSPILWIIGIFVVIGGGWYLFTKRNQF